MKTVTLLLPLRLLIGFAGDGTEPCAARRGVRQQGCGERYAIGSTLVM
jgi:hypothetical protein